MEFTWPCIDIDEHEWIVSTCRKGIKDGEPLPYAMETSKTRTWYIEYNKIFHEDLVYSNTIWINVTMKIETQYPLDILKNDPC